MGSPKMLDGALITDADPMQVTGTLHAVLDASGQVIGHVIVDSGSIAVSSLPALPAGMNVIGHMLVDSLPALIAGEAHAGEVGGRVIRADVTLTRPADTNAYIVGDVISNSVSATTLLVLPVGRKTGGQGYITAVMLNTNQKTNVSAFRIHFYNLNSVTVPVDNAPKTVIDANFGAGLGYVDVGPFFTGTDSGNSTSAGARTDNLRIPFVCAGGDSNIYALVELTATGFTPTSGQTFKLAVTVEAY